MPDDPLRLSDLRTCARRYVWYGRPIHPLVDAFEDGTRRLLSRLGRVDVWTRARGRRPEMLALATGSPRRALTRVFGEGATIGDARRRACEEEVRPLVEEVMSAIVGGVGQPVPETTAFPVTTLLRCLVPARFTILATPHDVTATVTPYKWHRRQIQQRQGEGLASLDAWESVAGFAHDYEAYCMRLRGLARRHHFEAPGEVDDGCWQMALCLSGRRPCPAVRRGGLCEAGEKAVRDPALSPLIQEARSLAREGHPDARRARMVRLRLFRRILEQSGETSSFDVDWEDALRLLLPDPALVRLVFSIPRRTPGSRGGTYLQWLERSFGHRIVSALQEELDAGPDVIGRYLDTHGETVRRRMAAPEPPSRSPKRAPRGS